MREIKYQAWDTNDERMISWQELLDYGSGLADYLQHPRELIFREYTGLKDLVGKEIYEGDILSFGLWSDTQKPCLHKIYWNDKTASFDVWDLRHNEWGGQADAFSEVIGNIYENPRVT